MKEKIYDVAVFGGGVVGSSIFNALAKSGYKPILIEKNSDVATGTSKANSGIVHAGFDAVTGTKKARFNIEGNKMFPSICERVGVPLKKIGAYVVGNDIESVKTLLLRGRANGISNLEFLGVNDLKKRIPNIADDVMCGLFAPDSYIVNPYLLTIALAEEGVVNGGEVVLNWDTKKVTKASGYFIISNGRKVIMAKKLVNACGYAYNEMAKILGTEKYKIEYKRGEYYVLDHSEAGIVNSTIFPLPDKHSKGILVTPTVDGNILVGPTSYLSDDTTITTDAGLSSIKEKSKTLLKNVDLSKTIRTFAGVRSVVGDDFVIEVSKKNPNIVNLAGICSPGLSSAPAIAKYVVGDLLKLKYNPDLHNVKIRPYQMLKDLPESKVKALIKQNPSYGKIVCKCESISEGEIVDAIDRPIRPTTTDGIKRRIRAGMGRCQGSFCLDRVIKILARENHCDFDDIRKENGDSRWVVEDVKGGVDSEN